MDSSPLGAVWDLAEGVGSCTGCVTATVSAAAFLALTPVTHALGGRTLFGASSWSPRSTLFKGGASFITFQVLAWTFWASATLLLTAAVANVLFAIVHRALPSPVLAGAAVCGSFLAEVLMVCSLLTFEARLRGGPTLSLSADKTVVGLALPRSQPRARTARALSRAPHAALGCAVRNEGTPRRAAPAPRAAGSAAHRRAKSESVDYDFGWETESDEDEGDSPKAAADQPSPAKPKRSLDRPAAQAPSPQRHRRTVSAHARRTEPPLTPRAAVAEAAVVTALDALRGHAGAALIICLCVLLSLTGHGLVASVALEAVAGTPARVLFIAIAFLSLAIAGPVTHGLGGRLRHSKTGNWRFFQPWRGGVAFVACQALGWALYSVSIAAFGVAFWLIGAALAGHGVAHAGLVLPATFWVAGAAGVGAQVVLACSLLTYRPGGAAAAPPPAAKQASALPAREALVRHGAMLGVLFMVYAPCHLLVAAVATLFLAMPPAAATAVLAAASAAYARTYVGHPAHTGTRTWPRFRSYCESVLSVALSRWFGTVRVLRTAPHHQAGTTGTPIVFGYHPHGMYPAAAAWFHLTPQWRDNFPGVAPVTMGASAIFMTPMLRDVVMWSGARVVSRLSVRRALHTERRPIVLCPGGQAELVEHRAGTETVLCTRHKGFIRCALEVNAPVCPIFVFGESQAQRNLFSVKRLQRWTAKKLGFPFPFMPGGYMRVLPLPEPRPLTFVVGPLIPPPEGRDPSAPVTDAEVDAIHKRYYEELVELFEKHKASAGFPDATLVLKHD